MTKRQTSYEDAGVSIEAGNQLVERIKPLARATRRAGLMGGIGGFGGLFDLKAAGYHDPVLVSSTDGVGTKLKLAQALNRHETIGIDLVAMCVNDLVVQGAEPLFFLDYFATSALDVDIAEKVVAGIAEGCRQAGCALLGGETAEMPGLYQPGEYDLAGFAVGALERGQLLPQGVAVGDALLGLASSGVHSNGYSLVRHLLERRNIDLRAAENAALAQTLLTPTRLYIRSCLKAIQAGGVRALAHITGGGLSENIPRILPEGTGVEIETHSWRMPDIFAWLQEAGNIASSEMRRTFNCGIGMVLVVEPSAAETLATLLREAGETVYPLGRVIPRPSDDAPVRYL